jgi:hypothetical protein
MSSPTDPADVTDGAAPGLRPDQAHVTPGGSSRERRFLLILVGCAAALSLLVGAGLVAARGAGSIVVEVSGHGRGGDSVSLRVPAAAGHLALALLPDHAFSDHFKDRVFRRGEMRALVRQLELIPDGTVLVQVDSPRESVRISRERGLLLVHVDSDEENVRVEVPIKLAGALLKRMERGARVS